MTPEERFREALAAYRSARRAGDLAGPAYQAYIAALQALHQTPEARRP